MFVIKQGHALHYAPCADLRGDFLPDLGGRQHGASPEHSDADLHFPIAFSEV